MLVVAVGLTQQQQRLMLRRRVLKPRAPAASGSLQLRVGDSAVERCTSPGAAGEPAERASEAAVDEAVVSERGSGERSSPLRRRNAPRAPAAQKLTSLLMAECALAFGPYLELSSDAPIGRNFRELTKCERLLCLAGGRHVH